MTKADVTSTTNPVITVRDLEVHGGVVLIEDLRLADALGFSDRHMIRTLIKRHVEALQQFGEVSVMQRKPSAKGGRPSRVFYLNEEQAIFITAKSDTPRAAEITVEMVRVFRSYLKGREEDTPTGLVPVRAHARRRPKPGYGTVIADTDRLHPFIQRGDELVVEFTSRITPDLLEPSAIYVLLNPCTRKPEPHWLLRDNRGVWSKPDPNRYLSRSSYGSEEDLMARHWPVIGRVIGINKPTAAETRAELARCA